MGKGNKTPKKEVKKPKQDKKNPSRRRSEAAGGRRACR